MSQDFVVSVHNETTLLVEDSSATERVKNNIKDEVVSENIWLPGSSVTIRFGSFMDFNTKLTTCFFVERSDSKHSPEDYGLTLLGNNTTLGKLTPLPQMKYLDATKRRLRTVYTLESPGSYPNFKESYVHENKAIKYLIVFKNDCKFDINGDLHKMDLIVSDMSDYYDKGVGLDFTIMINDKTIKACKYVIGSYSTVFTAMFQNDWKDSLENTVNIEDVEYEVMLMMVKALHKVPVALDDVRTSLKLLVVVDKYCVECIKHQVVTYIKHEINGSNVIDVLTVAHQLNMEDMKQDALNFLTSNKSKNIEEIVGYNQMPVHIALLVLNETRNKLFMDQ